VEGSDTSDPPTAPEVEPEAEPSTEPAAPEEGEPAEPEAEPAEPTEPPASPEDDFLEFDGERYARSQVEAAARFQRQLADDTGLQQLIQLYLAGGAVEGAPTASPVGEGSAPAGPPEEIDLEDPSIAALYKLVKDQSDTINELRYGLNTTNAVQIQRQRQEIQSLYESASTSFAKTHNLEQEDIDSLSRIAARLGVLPQLMSGIDPITGAPASPDPLKAFDRALEIAMMSVPEYRDREFRRSVTVQQDEVKKRKLLGAVGGTSGSVARVTTPPKAGSPEARKEMLAEVGKMLNGEWSDPTAN
jgi:hypothetical protein